MPATRSGLGEPDDRPRRGHPVRRAAERRPERHGILDHPLSRMMTKVTGDIMDKTTPHPLFKLATELGPLMVFFIANAKANLYVATAAFMVAVVVALVVASVVPRPLPIMAIVSGVIVLVFGSLTLVLHDE